MEYTRCCSLFLTGALLVLGVSGARAANEVVLYETAFEPAEGYNPDFDLEGQLGWQATDGSNEGNSGLVDNFLEGEGYSAYIGFTPTESGDSAFLLWHPLSPPPSADQYPRARFSTVMSIFDSVDVLQYDCFGWAVYNQDATRLFTLVFDNFSTNILYILENGTNYVSTGFNFEPYAVYDLQIDIDFSNNLWSASLGDVTIVTNVPVTEFGSARNLGDVDAEWFYGDPSAPGDNFMVFDNYKVVGIPAVEQPTLGEFARLPNGNVVLRLTGQPSCRYALQATSNLVDWVTIRTETTESGVIDFLDTSAPGHPSRFYRAEVVPTSAN